MNADQIKEMYPEITRYILEHFTLFWTIIVGVFGIISIALYFICEKSVRRGVNKAVDAIKKSKKYNRLRTDCSVWKSLRNKIIPCRIIFH